MRRARVLVGVAAFVVVAAMGWLLANRLPPAYPPGDVREVISAYLDDEGAARDKYSDARVTASGVVSWSLRSDLACTRADGEWSPHLEALSKQATVLISVDDRHQILAYFGAENQREALAFGAGERVTIKGRHTGHSSTGVAVYDGKVILVLDGCEVVR